MAPSLRTSNIAHCRLSGGSYIPTQDEVYFITRPGEGTFPTYVPAGTEITCNNEPVFVAAPEAPSLPLSYCPGDRVLKKYQPVVTENNTLVDRTLFRVHFGRADTDNLDLPAGTLIRKAFQHCPSCLSAVAGAPETHPSSCLQAEHDAGLQDEYAPGTDLLPSSHPPDSVEIDAEFFMFSRFGIGLGDKLGCPTKGWISAFGVTNARGHFTLSSHDPSQVMAHSRWTSADAEECDRGDVLPLPFGRFHYRLANVVGARRSHCDDTWQHYKGDETLLSDLPIPTKFIQPLLDAQTSNSGGGEMIDDSRKL
jgi:hypothetical protein